MSVSVWYCEHGYFHGEDCPDCDGPSYTPSAFDLAADAEDVTIELRWFRAEAGITVLGATGSVVAYLAWSNSEADAISFCERVRRGERPSQVFPAYTRPPFCSASDIDRRAGV